MPKHDYTKLGYTKLGYTNGGFVLLNIFDIGCTYGAEFMGGAAANILVLNAEDGNVPNDNTGFELVFVPNKKSENEPNIFPPFIFFNLLYCLRLLPPTFIPVPPILGNCLVSICCVVGSFT